MRGPEIAENPEGAGLGGREPGCVTSDRSPLFSGPQLPICEQEDGMLGRGPESPSSSAF